MKSLTENIADSLLKLDISKPLLVTTKTSFDAHFKKLISDIPYVRFSDYQSNPLLEDVLRGQEVFIQNKCDGLISLGGGSAMDMAKMIALKASQFDIQLRDTLDTTKKLKLYSHLAVPTTAGSGSETTQFAVVYIDGQKHSVDHPSLRPNKCILEPQLLEYLPQHQVAYSGLDALCQAIESHWSRRSNEQSRAKSSKAIEFLWTSLLGAYHKESPALKKVQEGSHLAGQAINITRTTAPHALSYPLTSYFGFPHGQAVSLSLLYFMNINLHSDKKDYYESKEQTVTLINDIIAHTGCQSFSEFSDEFKRLCANMKTTIAQLNLSTEKKQDILKKINLARLSNNPVKINEQHIMDFLNVI